MVWAEGGRSGGGRGGVLLVLVGRVDKVRSETRDAIGVGSLPIAAVAKEERVGVVTSAAWADLSAGEGIVFSGRKRQEKKQTFFQFAKEAHVSHCRNKVDCRVRPSVQGSLCLSKARKQIHRIYSTNNNNKC